MELDGPTLQVRRRFDVDGQPTWLALHPSGKTLYVASAMGGRLTALDIESGLRREVDFPGIVRNGHALSLRLTGDLAVNDAGTRLAVPLLYVDESTVITEGGWSSGGDRLQPGVGVVPLDDSGDPSSASVVVTRVPKHTNDYGRSQARLGSYPSAVAFQLPLSSTVSTSWRCSFSS